MAEGGQGGEEPRLVPGCGTLNAHCLGAHHGSLASGLGLVRALSSPQSEATFRKLILQP